MIMCTAPCPFRSPKSLVGRGVLGGGMVALPERHYYSGHYPRCPFTARHPHAESQWVCSRPQAGCAKELTDKTLKFTVRPQIQGVGQADYSWD